MIKAQIVETEDKIAILQQQIEQLQEEIRLAKGTKEIPKKTKTVEDVISEKPRTFDEIVKVLNQDPEDVSNTLQELRRLRAMTNVGTEESPRWFLIIGNDVSTDTVCMAVEALIRDRPMTLQELVSSTGATAGRVSNAIRTLMRDSNGRVLNIGTPGRARWFVAPLNSVQKKPRRTKDDDAIDA